ncbi:MAG: SLC13 family permease [Planctomycetaceae bacterium]|nr:anion permease [Planctomycetaceae bacterium]
MNSQQWTAVGIFVACYALFVVFPTRRSIVACAGSVVLVLAGVLHWHEALFQEINWNVIGLFFGTMVLADVFLQSRMPAVMAEWLVDKTRTARGAMLAICVLSGFISMFVENVAVVLLIAPVAISLTKKLDISPVRLMILIAVSSNLQGTATLIGDPPSMILAGHLKLSFMDFFIYQGKLGIFFAVQAGAIASLVVAAWLLRKYRQAVETVPVEKVRSWVPTVLVGALVAGLSVTSLFDPGFVWLAGTFTMVLAAVALVWFRLIARWGSSRFLVRSLDWDTTFFLIGVFVVVGGLSEAKVLDVIAANMSAVLGDHPFSAFAAIVALSVLVSGFVDNVPFLLAMIPVVDKVAQSLDMPVPLLMFGMLVGSCLGGNITPIGASANIVAVGMLRKQGMPVTFRRFMAIGIPFTIAAVLASCAVVWWIWAP